MDFKLNSVDGTDPVERAYLLRRRAFAEIAEGRHAEGERLLGEAAVLIEAACGPESPDLATVLDDLDRARKGKKI
jgi:hypothetical protein